MKKKIQQSGPWLFSDDECAGIDDEASLRKALAASRDEVARLKTEVIRLEQENKRLRFDLTQCMSATVLKVRLLDSFGLFESKHEMMEFLNLLRNVLLSAVWNTIHDDVISAVSKRFDEMTSVKKCNVGKGGTYIEKQINNRK